MEEEERKLTHPPTHPPTHRVQHLIRTASICSVFSLITHPPTHLPTFLFKTGWEDVDVPERFMALGGGKKKKAVAAYRQMLRWRKENGIGEWVGGWVIGR